MTKTSIILTVIVAYQVVLLAIGWWASKRNHDQEDYYLGGRQLGPWVASLSAATSSSSAWSLLGVSGAAYTWGLQAIWLIPAVLIGFYINWYWIAPRLQQRSHTNGAVTLVEFLSFDKNSHKDQRLRRIGASIILFSFTFYIASQFQAAGTTFAQVLPVSTATAIIIGASIILIYVWLGGFWAASITDALQGLVMVAVAAILPMIAITEVGGFNALFEAMEALNEPGLLELVDQPSLITAIIFVLGLFAIGFGYPGQPHVVNRFMALGNADDIKTARRIAMSWGIIIFCGMVLLGWCARVLLADIDNAEDALILSSELLLHPVFSGIVIAGILSAIMSTADSQLLTAASAVSHDMGVSSKAGSLQLSRWVVLILGVLAVLLSILSPEAIFSRVLFAWQALAAAFGPILVIMLWRGHIQPSYKIASMLIGFIGTVGLSFTENAPGDALERWVPMLLALVICWLGSYKRV